MNRQAREIEIGGIVQGVGFRPFVYRLATRLGLAGHITNTGSGVVIKIAGPAGTVDSFLTALQRDAPPLARIDSLQQRPANLAGPATVFTIRTSDGRGPSTTQVAPDTATCADCLREIFNPGDRRYGYPFTNCTNCGPRYTIIRSLPYDRPRTTMNAFPMCPACTSEYKNPPDRRFHAQPNACADCGPRLSWQAGDGSRPAAGDPLARAAAALENGAIIGIKGLGGFHLATSAYSALAVATLRRRKNRPAKPLAVMARNLQTAQRLCHVSPPEEELLNSCSRPIVLLKKRRTAGLAGNLAPGMAELGVMLPYTPLHHLLFARPGVPDCLVMTSGNPAGEPLCKDNTEAGQRLAAFGDGFLFHNRGIHTRVDDSVVRVTAGKPAFLRRSRGYAPAPVRLGFELPPLLAVGGELKNSFCLARGRDAFMSQHIGDMNNPATFDFFTETVERLQTLLEIEPRLVVADQHPDYLSGRFAEQLGLPLVRVQHHWAHAASVMAEHGLDRALAVVLDGSGFGPDGTVWGGEILQCSLHAYKRLGRLAPLPLPGGDQAARQPWRMALAALHLAGIDEEAATVNLGAVAGDDQRLIREMMARDINCPLTSSCGRLFDAVASLLGICHFNTFEGQAAMELETLAATALGGASMMNCAAGRALPADLLYTEKNGILEASTDQCIRYIIEKMTPGSAAAGDIALFFHLFLVFCCGNMIRCLSRRTGIDTIVLSGGCLQNRLLVEGFFEFFAKSHLKVHVNRQVPANDGGIALGQAAIGGTHVSGDSHARH
ncbi:[NiFe] hydrogenase metallocenter assembly protein HypF [hydrothermal vent metagenome]|uniref:[NiFe] hydrogenase metallocenter assembly protein HypF n=1 Tax=hydrothermal vent metagenome TaxID=652676 RepID=A0A3B0VIJ0_9ZZZZ